MTLVLDEKDEWFQDILAGFTVESDVVIGELSRLLQSVFPADVIFVKKPINGILLFQEANYFTEVPSLILDIITLNIPKLMLYDFLDGIGGVKLCKLAQFRADYSFKQNQKEESHQKVEKLEKVLCHGKTLTAFAPSGHIVNENQEWWSVPFKSPFREIVRSVRSISSFGTN
jgi:hypothetical protein